MGDLHDVAVVVFDEPVDGHHAGAAAGGGLALRV